MLSKTIRAIARRIPAYVKALPPQTLGVENTESVEVGAVHFGAYNFNYRVKVDGKEFIFRVNVDQQSGLPHQVEYEFNALKFLEGHEIGPRVYHLDNTRDCFEYGVLIEEYLAGPPLTLRGDEIPRICELLVRLHSLDPGDISWMVWDDPLRDTYDQARRDLRAYRRKPTSDGSLIRLAASVLAETKPWIDSHCELFRADSVNHTDLAFDNFIKCSRGLRLIDWEKPRIDDASYDLGCLLSEPVQLWCAHLSEIKLGREQKEGFLAAYADLSGVDSGLLSEKVALREPLISLHWILWGATKLCDLRDRDTAPQFAQVHQSSRRRYERLADSRNVERILDST